MLSGANAFRISAHQLNPPANPGTECNNVTCPVACEITIRQAHAWTSIRRSVALVRSGPPLETAIAPLRERRKDQQRRRQSSLSVMNAGDQACPETRPCPHPSSGCRKPARTPAGKADGTDVLLANVESQHRHAAQLNTHAHPFVERLIGTFVVQNKSAVEQKCRRTKPLAR
jgi:hypothetical protein